MLLPIMMQRIHYLFVGVMALLACEPIAAQEPWKWQAERIPDPGFDLDSAQIVRVTSLATKGKGSLRDALKLPGPKIVVFEVAGVIDLEQKSIEIHDPGVYIAGQTAPSPGITIIKGGISIEADKVVLQHLKVRPGDAGMPKKSGWEPDGITTSGGPADVWIDHCSATWGLDENISASTYKSPTGEPARRIFIRNCIIAEGLNEASHDKGAHSKGTLVLDGTQNVAIVGNLFCSNVERNPVFKLNTSGVVVNNLIANPGERAIHASVPEAGDTSLPKARIAVVGNTIWFGEKSKRSARAIFEGAADAYFKDNEGYDWLGQPLDLLRTPFETLDKPPVWPEGLEPVSTTAALWQIVRFAGARPAERDAIDSRIVQQALTGKSSIINSQNDVGGYPKIEPVQRPLEVPEKNRRAWLDQLAREVELGADANVKPAKATEQGPINK